MSNYDKLSPLRKRDLTRAWRRFGRALTAWNDVYDDARSGSLDDYLSEAPAGWRLHKARFEYLVLLRDADMLEGNYSPPDDEELYDFHPMNLEDELEHGSP